MSEYCKVCAGEPGARTHTCWLAVSHSSREEWFKSIGGPPDLSGVREAVAIADRLEGRPTTDEVIRDLTEALQGILAITDRKHVAWDKAHAAIAKGQEALLRK